MGLFGSCKSCDKNLSLLRLGKECDFCRENNCKSCIEEFYFSHYYGYMKFFTTNLEHLNIAPPIMEGRDVMVEQGSDYRFHCNMCKTCYASLNMNDWLRKYEEAVKKAYKVTVLKGSSTKLNEKKFDFYNMALVGSKLDLIEAFKIRAHMEGNNYIFELLLEREKGGLWKGSCKAGK